jgi:hypothetical protein
MPLLYLYFLNSSHPYTLTFKDEQTALFKDIFILCSKRLSSPLQKSISLSYMGQKSLFVLR